MTALLTTLVDLFLPVVCAGCQAPGASLCVRCAGAFDGPFEVRRPTTGPITDHATGRPAGPTAHRPAAPTTDPPARWPAGQPANPPIHALATYADTARTVVLAFKERGRRDLAVPLGRLVAAVLPTLDGIPPPATWWLVPAPSRRSAARRRGGSHMLALARHAAQALADRGRPAAVAPALRLARGARDSAGLDARERVANLAGRVQVHPAGVPPSRTPVILLDDVVTTGATVAAATKALRAAGFPVAAVVTLTAT